MREGASMGGTWITGEVVCSVMRSHGRRVQVLLMAMPVAKCTAPAMVFGEGRGRRGGPKQGRG